MEVYSLKMGRILSEKWIERTNFASSVKLLEGSGFEQLKKVSGRP